MYRKGGNVNTVLLIRRTMTQSATVIEFLNLK